MRLNLRHARRVGEELALLLSILHLFAGRRRGTLIHLPGPTRGLAGLIGVLSDDGVARRVVTDCVDAASFGGAIVRVVRCGRDDVGVREVVFRLDLRDEVREGDARVVVDRIGRALPRQDPVVVHGPFGAGRHGDNTSLRDDVVLPLLQFGEDRSVEVTFVKTGTP
jgi:hypothetical protein